MQINAVNNQPTFGQIFLPKGKTFTKNQKIVVDNIINTLREKSPKFNNKTAEEFYESKHGIDFNISDYSYSDEAVFLEGLRGVKNVGTGIEEAITYRDSFKIGIYDKEHPFKTHDIDTGMKEQIKNNGWFAAIGVAVIATLLSLMGMEISHKGQPKQETPEKPLIENIDSAAVNKVAAKDTAVFKDTLKVLSKIKK